MAQPSAHQALDDEEITVLGYGGDYRTREDGGRRAQLSSAHETHDRPARPARSTEIESRPDAESNALATGRPWRRRGRGYR